MRVAIDGPAGSGKSTVAREVAKRCHITYLDTGAMYRAVTWKCLSDGVPVTNADRVARIAREIQIHFGTSPHGQTVHVDGMDVTAAIRTAAVDRNVSAVSAIPAVRRAMVSRQRQLGSHGDVVAEGRDIGTVVFPDAEVKVFLTADAATRAHRRAMQREGMDAAVDEGAPTDAGEEKQILDELLRRDELDRTRQASPLRMAAGAREIDSTSASLEDVVDEIVSMVGVARNKGTECSEKAASVASTQHQRGPASHPASKSEKKLKAFRGNSFDDYRDAAMRNYPLPAKMLMGTAVGVVGALTKFIWPWQVEDGEKLWVKRLGRMLVMNHSSMLDPVVTYITLAVHGIRCRFIYKSEFDKSRIASWFLSRAGAIPVDRGKADLKAVRRAVAALKRGECVLVFPEGTRIRSEDQPVTLHGGFALMAQLAKVPVQPLAIVGSRQISPQKTHFKRLFWRVYIKAGDVMSFEDIKGVSRKEASATMERLVMEQVYKLRDELRVEHPGKI